MDERVCMNFKHWKVKREKNLPKDIQNSRPAGANQIPMLFLQLAGPNRIYSRPDHTLSVINRNHPQGLSSPFRHLRALASALLVPDSQVDTAQRSRPTPRPPPPAILFRVNSLRAIEKYNSFLVCPTFSTTNFIYEMFLGLLVCQLQIFYISIFY